MSLELTPTVEPSVPPVTRREPRRSAAKRALQRRTGMTLVRERPGLDFSLTGLIYCCLMLFMGLAANNSQANLLFATFGLMIGILLISGVISRSVVRRLKVRRVLPEHGVVGRTLRAVYEITNLKRFWPSLSVSISELDGVQGFTHQPQSYLLHVAPGMTAIVPSELVAKRRGLYEFDRFQLGTSFPFGFIKRAIVQRHKEHLVIYPPLARVDSRLLTLCRSADLSGPTMRPRSGGSDEFYGVKEFRRGDNPRWIYWRRSARTGVLVSKEMTKVSPPRLLILVETRLSEPTLREAVLVEKSIAMAASLAAKGARFGSVRRPVRLVGRMGRHSSAPRKDATRRNPFGPRPTFRQQRTRNRIAAGELSRPAQIRDHAGPFHAARCADGAA